MKVFSKAIDNLLLRYTHLPIAGQKVRSPYWKDKPPKKIWGPYGGKGSPEELIGATLSTARAKGIDLAKLDAGKIRLFMKKNRIGLDCSGLAFKLLDALDKEKGGNGIEDDIPGSRGRFLVRASVAMLTDDQVSLPIRRISQIEVGDMIRLNEGKHLLVVVEIGKNEENKIKEIVYAHSSPGTEQDGVHTAKIFITNENRGLEYQEWEEKTQKGENYGKKFFLLQSGDGIRRLKILA